MLKFAANGASDYIVLVDEATASPSEIYAASEFVSFAGQVTGAIMPLMTTCTPVSYTHLDVYKRQAL